MTTTLGALIAYLAPLNAQELASLSGAALDMPVQRVLADSRLIAAGDLFVAVRGGRHDGYAAIADALARGAIAAIGALPRAQLPAQGNADASRAPLPADLVYLQVADSRAALASANDFLHGFPSRALRVIGVTGTDGKTTTSSLIEAILVEATRDDANPLGSVGVVTTLGARIRGVEQDTGLHVTTPDAPDVQRFLAQMRDEGCTHAVVESTSHGLDQQRVGAVDFDVAVVTNITHEHLDYHGTREAYVAAKALLFRALFHSQPKPGVPRYAILNADDEGSFDVLGAAIAEEEANEQTGRGEVVRMRSYGLPAPATKPDIYATQIEYNPDSTRFRLHWWWGPPFAVETRLIGAFNLYNVMAAAAATLALGIPQEVVARAIAGFSGVLGRMQRMDAGQDFLAIVDFAHSPVSLERALVTLRPLVAEHADGTPGRLIAVFGSAGLRDRAKRRWMGQVSGRLADFTVITAEDPRTEDVNDICAEIASGVREHVGEERFIIIPDRSEAIAYAAQIAQKGDIVAAFGKGHERSMCYGETEYPWSDQDAMLAALQAVVADQPQPPA